MVCPICHEKEGPECKRLNNRIQQAIFEPYETDNPGYLDALVIIERKRKEREAAFRRQHLKPVSDVKV